MNEAQKPDENQGAPPTPAPIQEPKPVDPAPAKPAAAQQLTVVEERMSVFEKSTLRWARTAVIMSGLAAIFVCLQWWEMHTGGADTHNLAVAAGNQASWTQRLSDNTKIQTDRTQDLAERMRDQAVQTKKIADQAVIQAKAAISAANTAKYALHTSERAYVVVETPSLDTQSYTLEIPLVNTGHIPSGNVNAVLHIATIDVESTAPPSGVVPSEQHWAHYEFGSMPPSADRGPLSNTTYFTIQTPTYVADWNKIKEGHQQIIVAGSVSYGDGFPDDPQQIWLFCDAYLYFTKANKVQWTSCDPTAYINQLSKGDHYPNEENVAHRRPN